MARLKEQLAWDGLKRANADRLTLHRIENLVGTGMPDIIGKNRLGVVFWIESKALHAWPARDTTKPMKDAFEPGQIPFLKAWMRFKGNAFVLLKVGKEAFLLNPKENIEIVDMTRDDIVKYSLALGMSSIVDYLMNLEHR